jgi:hypothetical protein
MAVTPYRGKFHIEWYPVTVSTAFTAGDMVTILSTAAGVGTLAKVVDGSTFVIGTIQKTIASTDSDYATARKVPVLVGDADAEWLATAAGSAAATDVGEMVGFDDEVTIDVTDYTEGQFKITDVISTTLVVGKFNKGFGLEIPITA